MKKIKYYTLIALILLFISFNLLSLATIFYAFETDIEDYNYSDTEEYDNINDGLKIINSLPIQFNISNKYFSNFDNLPEETRQSIILAYTIKNNIATYSCGTNQTSICIDKDQIAKSGVLDIFNSETKLVANNIKLYIDNYGNYNVNTSNTSTYYKVNLEQNQLKLLLQKAIIMIQKTIENIQSSTNTKKKKIYIFSTYMKDTTTEIVLQEKQLHYTTF